jgi:hypothetical protein
MEFIKINEGETRPCATCNEVICHDADSYWHDATGLYYCSERCLIASDEPIDNQATK